MDGMLPCLVEQPPRCDGEEAAQDQRQARREAASAAVMTATSAIAMPIGDGPITNGSAAMATSPIQTAEMPRGGRVRADSSAPPATAIANRKRLMPKACPNSRISPSSTSPARVTTRLLARMAGVSVSVSVSCKGLPPSAGIPGSGRVWERPGDRC